MSHEVFGATVHDAMFAHECRKIAGVEQNPRLMADVLPQPSKAPGTERISKVARRLPDGLFQDLDILIGYFGRATLSGLVDQAGQAFGIESVDDFEHRVNGYIPLIGNAWSF